MVIAFIRDLTGPFIPQVPRGNRSGRLAGYLTQLLWGAVTVTTDSVRAVSLMSVQVEEGYVRHPDHVGQDKDPIDERIGGFVGPRQSDDRYVCLASPTGMQGEGGGSREQQAPTIVLCLPRGRPAAEETRKARRVTVQLQYVEVRIIRSSSAVSQPRCGHPSYWKVGVIKLSTNSLVPNDPANDPAQYKFRIRARAPT